MTRGKGEGSVRSVAEAAEIEQDLHAMRCARTRGGVESIAEAMRALGRWSDRAESVYGEALMRHDRARESAHDQG